MTDKLSMNDLTFGIEIETTMPVGSVTPGRHGNGIQVEWLPTGWKADRDPSIRPGRGRMACEYVSPVLKGAEGLRQVAEVIRAISARGGRVNPSCGMHVHVFMPERMNGPALKRLLNIVALHEPAYYAATGTKRRERGSWCRSIRPRVYAMPDANRKSADSVRRSYQGSRYMMLNLANWIMRRQPTAEFRVYSATLNVTKALAYIQMSLAAMARSLNLNGTVPSQTAKPAHETTGYKRAGGPGRAAMAYWLDCFGWTGKRKPYLIEAEGLPSAAAMANEMKRLARKYDENDDRPTYRRRNGAMY